MSEESITMREALLRDIKDLKRERDEARDCFSAAMKLAKKYRQEREWDLGESNARLDDALEYRKERDEAQRALVKARDRCLKLGRERNHWKSESLEQAKLLAMSADREEKLRGALKYITGLDTSQDTSPQQCSAVAVAMEALQ